MKTSLLLLAFFLLAVTSCTAGGGASSESSYIEPVKEIIGDLIGGEAPEMKATIEQVKAVQQTLNQDPVYSITKEDQELLATENLLDDESELKAWVK